jgi:hypothetical protein
LTVAKLVRVRKDVVRVIGVSGKEWVITIGTHGVTFRRLRTRKRDALALRWQDLQLEGRNLDALELESRPLLALAFQKQS